jgi:hypothetical protein
MQATDFVVARNDFQHCKLVETLPPDAGGLSEWRPGGVDARFSAAWSGFAPKLDGWLRVIESRGPKAVQQVYLDTLAGRIPPDQGHMLSLTE